LSGSIPFPSLMSGVAAGQQRKYISTRKCFITIESMASGQQSLQVEDDGLASPDVRRWAETKYRLLALYDELFSSGMKNKWDQRVYIDLYAAAGYSHIVGTKTFLKGSPVIALTVASPFDRYIFCEESPELLNTLRARAKRIAPEAPVTYIPGSCDSEIDKICAAIPKGSSTNKVLSLCLVDPFDFGIKFETIRRLSSFYMDFVVLLAIGMDANRNYDHYVDGDSTKIDEALGNTEWRDRWKAIAVKRREFRKFLASEFSKSMESLGYLKQRLDRMKLVKSDDKNLPLYYLALFSRHPTAYKLWDEVLKYSTDQTGFDWG
jgi:three-Cys-motif partner protein